MNNNQNKCILKIILFAFSFSLSALSLRAQTWEAGGSVGGSGYMGDINQRSPVKISGLSAGVFVQRNLNPYFSLKLNYTHGKIQGADSTSNNAQQRDRNLSFRTTLSELSLMGEFNFMKYTPGADDHHFSPFVFFGIGAVDYNPQAGYLGSVYDLRPLGTEGQSQEYARVAMVIPYGAGIKYNFNSSWNIMLNAGYRYVRSDYLDDISGVYPDRTRFVNPLAAALSDRSGERTGTYIGVPGTQRGDFRSRDTYMFIGFTLSFTFVTSNCYY